jgi:flagellar biosynthesis/type III secretory pathway protein FliH
MIFRDAILSDEPYTLRAESQESPMVHEVTRPVPMRRPYPVLTVLQASTEADTAVEAHPSVEVATLSQAPALTPAAVSKWLVEQDRETLVVAIPGLEAELEEIREDAYAAGFNVGQVDGRAAAREQVLQQGVLLKSLVDAVRSQCEQEQARLSTLCVDIVAVALGKIGGPLLATREAAYAAVTEALARAKAGHELTVRVNPTDLPGLEAQHAQLSALLYAPLQWVADPQVVLGGCVVESQPGTLDARFEVQLQGLYDTLRLAKQQVPTP